MDQSASDPRATPREEHRLWWRLDHTGWLTTAPITHYALAVPVAAASSFICELIKPWAQLADFVIVYLLGVVAIAARCPPGPSLFAAVISVLSFDFFCIPPLLQLSWPDAGSVLTFVGMVVVAAVISGLNQGL